MNLSQWKTAATENLETLARSLRSLAPNLLHGALSSATLLPVVLAANQGDFAALAALGSVVGGVGGNLIANQIQSWRDRSQAELAAELQERAEADPEWLETLDALLVHFEAPLVVQTILAEADRDWFTRTLRQELDRLGSLPRFEALLEGSGAIAQGPGAVAAGERGLAAGGHVVFAERGATVVIGEAPVTMTAVDRRSALSRYLVHVISRTRYLQLQGIRSKGRLVHIELDRIYVRLRATRHRLLEVQEQWLAEEAALAPGELRRLHRGEPALSAETVTVNVEQALAEHPRLVILGDPGSGKTTLLRYLALLYGRDLAETDSRLVAERLGLAESGWLPILLPLRQIGAFLSRRQADGAEGHALLLDFLLRSLKNERIELPGDFFDPWLAEGRAVILLDGLDEVADPDLRRRVSRLVESFSRAYPDCRYVVTSRLVGYSGAARLGENYATTTIQDFSLADVKQFLSNWHRLVAIGQMGAGASAEAYAAGQTNQLLQAVQANERIRELAINPLLLTVIALVHRDRVKLPDRRAELYAEAVDVLLGKWEEAKGVQEIAILPDKPFDAGDKRLMLQSLALHMHEKAWKEIAVEDLRRFLGAGFQAILRNWREAGRAVDRFLGVIEERTGLLVARGEGVYAFSHLTFQEYLAALAVAAREDNVVYTLDRAPDPWWREVILLEAGHLSTQSRERTARLVEAIADLRGEPEPYHNLVLAAECLRDVGGSRVGGDLEAQVQGRLRKELETPPPLFSRWFTRLGAKGWIERRAKAVAALVRAGAGYWTPPYGEPEWVEIPAGEFWMGSERGYNDERPQHKLYLDAFQIARTPISNAQYHLFVQATDHGAPGHWQDKRPPRGLESHPVVDVDWYDALAYCRWLSQVTGKAITLPSEAQWEKAARGHRDRREYPWGDVFDPTRCNSSELGLGGTTPVGVFTEGASSYGVLDLSGNVWEWTSSLWGEDREKPDFGYPYDSADGRENLSAPNTVRRVVRGGSFIVTAGFVRCAYRSWYGPLDRFGDYGFRIVVLPPHHS